MGKAKKIAYSEISFPFPFTNREVLVYGFGANKIKVNGKVYCIAKSFSLLEDPELKDIIGELNDPRRGKNLIDLLIHYYGFEMTPISADEISCRGVMMLDPNLDTIPDSLINWGTT